MPPLLVKFPAVEKLAPFASVNILALLFRPARALVAPDMIVPPSSVKVEEFVVMLMPLPTFRLPPSTKVPLDNVEPRHQHHHEFLDLDARGRHDHVRGY